MELPIFAELLNKLFDTHRRPDGREYSNSEVAQAIGGTIAAAYISKLRSGKIENPGRNTMKRLCMFFQVPASYFFPELEFIESQQDHRQRQLQLALRAYGLNPELYAHVEALLSALAGAERECGG